MSESKMKTVWRLNTGNGVPSGLGGQLLYKGKSAQIPTYRSFGSNLWRLDAKEPIYAYQTNRTKSAKYR